MPIYEYRCAACGASFEHLARTLHEPPPACPTCGAEHVRKLLSSFSAHMAAGKGASAGPPPGCAGGTCASGTCPYARG